MSRFEFKGRVADSGAFREAHVFVDGDRVWPDDQKKSRAGKHWTSIWNDIPSSAVVVEFGAFRRGESFLHFTHPDGSVAEEIDGYDVWKR